MYIQAQQATQDIVNELDPFDIHQIDLLKSFQDIDDTAICQYNQYYGMYELDTNIKNLTRSIDWCLNVCEDNLRDEVREGLVVVFSL